jgi:hypothetical protein
MGYMPIYMFVTGSLQKLYVSYMPSLSSTQMLNATGKFANIVVWQREPLCAAVSRFSYRYKVIAPFAKLKTDLVAFCEASGSIIYAVLILSNRSKTAVNHGFENRAG